MEISLWINQTVAFSLIISLAIVNKRWRHFIFFTLSFTSILFCNVLGKFCDAARSTLFRSTLAVFCDHNESISCKRSKVNKNELFSSLFTWKTRLSYSMEGFINCEVQISAIYRGIRMFVALVKDSSCCMHQRLLVLACGYRGNYFSILVLGI